MKAPDKIYVAESLIKTPYGNEWSPTPYISRENTEYIRKDALMNYFNKRVEELNSPLNGVFGSAEREHCNERISELLLLIDKLNSM